jgi:hypothetical protein
MSMARLKMIEIRDEMIDDLRMDRDEIEEK